MRFSTTSLFIASLNHYPHMIVTETPRLAKIMYNQTTQKVVAFLKAAYRFAIVVKDFIMGKPLSPQVRGTGMDVAKQLFPHGSARLSTPKEIEKVATNFRSHKELEECTPYQRVEIPKQEVEVSEGPNYWETFPTDKGFPDELGVRIFSYLTPKDLCLASEVSTQFNAWANDPWVWKESVESELGHRNETGVVNLKEVYKTYSPDKDKGQPKVKVTVQDEFNRRFTFSCPDSTTIGKLKVIVCDHLRIDRTYAQGIKFLETPKVEDHQKVSELKIIIFNFTFAKPQ